MRYFSVLLLLGAFWCGSPSMQAQLAMATEPLPPLSEEEKRDMLRQLVDESSVFRKNFTGFALFDPIAMRMLYEKDADKYYTPASNTKILTLYTALHVLGDSLPALRYVIQGDSLIFWGTANPMMLHPAFPMDTVALAFLHSRSEQLFFSPHNFQDERFAPGWSWDDYQYAYQPERFSMPLYGNTVVFERSRVSSGFESYPSLFASTIAYNPRLNSRYARVVRRADDNRFEYNSRALAGYSFRKEIPFRCTPELVARLLADTLGRPVGVLDLMRLEPARAYTLQTPLPDTLYRRLMQNSDNFVAEHLLLACSEKLFGAQRAEDIIAYATENLLADMPGELHWVDGSGLSRQNMFTPKTMIALLFKLYQEVPQDRLLSIFPAGGRSGTIRNFYGGREPYVFAKTGTLRGVHTLSGYIVTAQKKVLLFSFMHNNFPGDSYPLKTEMEKVLKWVAENH